MRALCVRRGPQGALRERLLARLVVPELRGHVRRALAELRRRQAVARASGELLHLREDLPVLVEELIHLLRDAPVGEDAEDALIALLALEVLGEEAGQVLERGDERGHVA